MLRNARNALERTPSMTANLDEEKIRDLLLVLLNAQFEGAAAGEVFNEDHPGRTRPAPELPDLAGHQGRAPAFHPHRRADHDHHQVHRGDRGTRELQEDSRHGRGRRAL